MSDCSKKRAHNKYCCNPFSKPRNHCRKVADLRPFPKEYKCKFPSLNIANNAKICSTCRKLLKDYNEKDVSPIESQPSSSGHTSNTVSPEYCRRSIDKDNFQEYLAVLENSPTDPKRFRSESYAASKYNRAKESLKNTFENARGGGFCTTEEQDLKDYQEMLRTMKTKFDAPDTSRAKKLQILALLPDSFNVNKMCRVFGTSKSMATVAIRLRKERGILETPHTKRGVPLADKTVSLIQAFYDDDNYSRMLPGKKDCISVKSDDGTRQNIQKKLLLNNLVELHQEFKQKYPNCKVGFSKFTELRPKYCILAGGTGTHTVCVCTHHQNVKLMLDGLNISEITRNWEFPISGSHAYKAVLQRMVCTEPHADCYHGRCKLCPEINYLETLLKEELENRMIDTIIYKQWLTTDRCTIQQLVESSDDFISSLCMKLKNLLWHDYIAKQQNRYLTKLKQLLKPGQFIVTLDFSENYAFIVQEAAQAFHWSNNQATVHQAETGGQS